jgi:ribose 5-phosphate isomerase B
MKKLITEDDVRKILKKGRNVIIICKDTLVTPLALDMIGSNRMTIVEKEPSANNHSFVDQNTSQINRRISIGSDHTGFKMKNILIKYLGERGFQLNDEGTFDEKSCDYPDFAKAVALKIATGNADAGIILDATGIPSSITANKIKGIRAATCYNSFSAKSAREHNDANVLVLGAKSLGEETIKTIVEVWFSTNFAGGRHQRRLDKITSIENGND